MFFRIVGVWTRWFSFDTIAVAGRILSAILLALGWNVLGHALSLPASFRLLAACIFASLSLLGSFSGEWLLGGFESKVPAWGLCLAAVGFWIRGQLRHCPGWMTAAGLACGSGGAMHPVVGGWIAACLCFATLPTVFVRQKPPWKSIAGLVSFAVTTIVVSLPGVIPALQMVLEDSLPKKERQLASFYQVFWRLKHHLDPMEISARQWIYAAIMSAGILVGALFLRRNRVAPSRLAQNPAAETPSHGELIDSSPLTARPKGLPEEYFSLLLVFGMSALIALMGVVIGWHTVPAQQMSGWEWRAAILKFYPFRCFDGLLPITASYIAAQLLRQQMCERNISGFQPSKAAIIPLIVLTAALALGLSWRSRSAAPAGYNISQFADWKTACHWIRNNTPQDSLVLTPRESFAFKWFAERAEFVCYKDCPQDAAGILTWNKRLWMLHDWTSKSSADGQYDHEDLILLRQQTGCNFLITRTLGPFEDAPVWQGQVWSIYVVPDSTASAPVR